MTIWTLALNTLNGFLRNKILILFALLFLGMLLLMLSPILLMKAMKNAGSPAQAQNMIFGLISGVMTFATAFGSFISIWAAADTVSREMKSGTILAVMARPIRRWEYLLGKYLGVQMLMVLYVALMLILSYVLAAIAGETIFSSPIVLIVYPLVRYAIYSAMSLLLVTWLHPFVAMGVTIVIGILAHAATAQGLQFLPDWIRAPLAYVLPSTNLLSEVQFLTLTRTSLKPAPIADHLTALAYGLDYAAILFLLAAWAFRKRRLTSD